MAEREETRRFTLFEISCRNPVEARTLSGQTEDATQADDDAEALTLRVQAINAGVLARQDEGRMEVGIRYGRLQRGHVARQAEVGNRLE